MLRVIVPLALAAHCVLAEETNYFRFVDGSDDLISSRSATIGGTQVLVDEITEEVIGLQIATLMNDLFTCTPGDEITFASDGTTGTCPDRPIEFGLIIGKKATNADSNCFDPTDPSCYACVVYENADINAAVGGPYVTFDPEECTARPFDIQQCSTGYTVLNSEDLANIIRCDDVNVNACDGILPGEQLTWQVYADGQMMPSLVSVDPTKTYGPIESRSDFAQAITPGAEPQCGGGGGGDPFLTAPFIKEEPVFLDLPTDGTFAVVYSHLGFTISASSFEPANTQNSIDDAMPISFFDTIRVSNDGDVAIDVAPIRPNDTNVDKGSAHGPFVVKMRNATTLNELPFDETVLGGITIAYNADSRALRVAGSGAESVTLTAEIPTSKYIDPAEASKYAFMNVHIDAFPKNDDWSGALGELSKIVKASRAEA